MTKDRALKLRWCRFSHLQMSGIRYWCHAIILAVVGGFLCSVTIAEEVDELRERSRLAWNKYLKENCSTGLSEQAVRKLMDKKYRDVAFARANEVTYRLLFLIDDYHQVEFEFLHDSTLLMTPRVERKGRWIRTPDGKSVSIPEPAEAARKARVEAAALQYIAGKTNHEPESLRAYGSRGATQNRWVAVVTLDNLQMDAPFFLVAVTDDGHVDELSLSDVLDP